MATAGGNVNRLHGGATGGGDLTRWGGSGAIVGMLTFNQW